MSRTYRVDPSKRKSIYAKESGVVRRKTRRQSRHNARLALELRQFEHRNLDNVPGTCGWLTH